MNVRTLVHAPRIQPVALALLACLALAAVQGYDLYREWSRSIETSRSNTANLARLLEAQTQHVLEETDILLAAAMGLVRQWPGEAALPALRRLLDGQTAVKGFVVVDANGQTLFSEPGLWTNDPAVGQRWQAVLESLPDGQHHVGRAERGSDGRWRLPLARPVPRDAGAPRTIVVALVKHAEWQSVFDAVDVGLNGFVTLFQADGWIVATAPRNDALLERRWNESPLFQQHLPRAPFDTVRQVVVRDGTERIYSYRRLADWPLVVSVGVSMTDALADWRQRLVWQGLLLVVVAAALLTAAWHLQSAQRAVAAARDRAEGSERLLQDVSDNLPLRISYFDRDLRYRFVNEANCQRFGRPRAEIIGRTRAELTGQPTQPALEAAISAALAGEPQRFELEDGVGEDGYRFIETYLVPARGPDGAVVGVYSASTDVTERRLQRRRIEQALAERETLLREVYHRVKNNLQVVRSLLSLQRRSLADEGARSALEDAGRRIQAMAVVHEMLYQTGTLQAIDLRAYTQKLLQHLGESVGAATRGIALEQQVDEVEVSLEAAVPYGLLVNELVGNSLKHAFPAGRGGRVRVRLERAARGSTLQVEDDGVGLPAGLDMAQAASMGLQLAQSLARQLGGMLRAGHGPGAQFAADLPGLERSTEH
jgi:PAS domain S-box-containing protein